MAFSAEAFFNDSRDPLFSLLLDSAGGTLVAANPAFLRFLGRDQQDVVGAPLASFVAESSLPSLQSAMAAARAGQRARLHVLIRSADGGEHALEAHGTPSSDHFHCVGRRVLWIGEAGGEHVTREVLLQNVVRGVVDALAPKCVMLTRAIGWPVTHAEVIAAW